MENNNFQDIDERKVRQRNLLRKLLYYFIIYLIFSSAIRFIGNIIDYNEQIKEEKEMYALVTQKNREIELLTEINESFFTSNIDYLEFENGIQIPLPNHLVETGNIASCKKGFESNEIANNSYVVRVNYGENNGTSDLLLDIFKDRLDEDHNYVQVYYYDDYGTRIFTRNEIDGYFSYMIFRGTEVTFGVSYGEPKIKNI